VIHQVVRSSLVTSTTTPSARTLPLAPSSPDTLGADGAFSYECHRCLRCCRDKRIRVNPYESLRLARSLGMSTTDFLARHTTAQGTELARTGDGRCVFLGAEGCTVHADRPLVCRLYPLGRRVSLGEPDRFHHLDPHPESDGVFSDAGTVADYLATQDAAPFMHAADVYLDVVATLADALSTRDALPADGEDDLATAWLDIDAVLAREGAPPPADAEEAMALHRAALLAWCRTFTTPKEER
jgi:Fe-S-cluster containining protein